MNEILIQPTGSSEVVEASNGSVNVITPIKITRRGRRTAVALPDGTTLQPRAWDNTPTPLQLALARGHRLLQFIESGQARTLADVAEMEGMDRSYRLVNLTTLAPDIVAAILDESLPEHVSLFDLCSGTPLLWDEQRALLEKPSELAHLDDIRAAPGIPACRYRQQSQLDRESSSRC